MTYLLRFSKVMFFKTLVKSKVNLLATLQYNYVILESV